MKWFCATIAACIIGATLAYPTGAPQEACSTFSANHTDENTGSSHAPQNSIAPYKIEFSSTSVEQNEEINVIIKGKNGEVFKGFLIQGQISNGNSVGKFHSVVNVTQTLDCQHTDDSATHVERSDKPEVILPWTAPPNYTGNVIFKAVIVKSYAVFWDNVYSEQLTIT